MTFESTTSIGDDVLGMVLSGSLSEGLEVRLALGKSTEEIKVGTFVTVQGEKLRFFGVVTDISLESSDPNLKSSPPEVDDLYVRKVLSGTIVYGTIKIEPMLTLADGGDSSLASDAPQPAKTVPAHFAQAALASDFDVERVFGTEDAEHFWIGTPLDMETKLCLNIDELVKRSNGIFGKSGTGKTFLTRLLLIGILQSKKASNLVFDMQSEYGWKGYSEHGGEVKGLKQLFSSEVAIFSLDEEHSRRRGLTPDYVVRIGYEEIDPEDIQMLKETLGLSDVAADAAYSLQRHLGSKGWLKEFLSLTGREGVSGLAEEINVNQQALIALQRRLSRLQRFGFIDESTGHDSVNQILTFLERGKHVVLEFGRYGTDLAAYILVANLLTRRIHSRYVELMERTSGAESKKPKPLVITIEEAHKFLTPAVAEQTIFGNIAREMRKYNVTLLVVDQRPSGIDQEIMSQLGTKITCLLDSDRDIDAVMSGVPGSRRLRSVLARLESKQQALAFGHALPMPVVIRVRDYGTIESYQELGWKDAVEVKAQMDRDVEDLFGPTEK